MAGVFTRFGNDLYTGATSVPFVRMRRVWFVIAAVLMALSVAVPFIRGGGNFFEGFNFGIEFRGGSQFQVQNAQPGDDGAIDTGLARAAVETVVEEAEVRVTTVGGDGVRVQTDQLTNDETREVTLALEDAYGTSDVTSSFIGPTWGADITRQALIGLGAFLAFAMILMALYFRTWKMSLAAILALVHDVVVTVGVYAAIGFEITPAAVIGFLTILGLSLYDTVVVFDKIRESTAEQAEDSQRTFGETVNLAVNQTLVRTINTSVVAVLPAASILLLGALALGADTLRDISLALAVGTVVGTYSTPFLASPVYAWLREREPKIAERDRRVLALREKSAATA